MRGQPGKDPVPIVQEAGWDPGPVWTGAENLAPTGIFFFYERFTLFYHLNKHNPINNRFHQPISHLQKTASQYTSDSAQRSYKHVLCVKKSQTTSASSPQLGSIETMVSLTSRIHSIPGPSSPYPVAIPTELSDPPRYTTHVMD